MSEYCAYVLKLMYLSPWLQFHWKVFSKESRSTVQCVHLESLSLSFSLSLSLSIDFFFVPLFSISHQMSARQLCSDGRAKQTVFFSSPPHYRARAQTPKQSCAQTNTPSCVSQRDLRQRGSRTFVPESADFSPSLFFSLPAHLFGCMQPHQYKTDASNSLVTADKHGLLHSEGQEFGSFCFLIGLGFFFFLCASD